MKRHHFLTRSIPLFSAGLIILSALISPTVSSSAANSSLSQLPTAAQSQNAMGSLPDDLTAIGMSQFSQEFNSVSAKGSGVGLIVYVTTLDPSFLTRFSAAVPSQFSGTPIEFALSANNAVAESGAAKHIESLSVQSSIKGSGIDIRTVFPEADGYVHLGVYNLTPAQSTQLQSQFGQTVIRVDNLSLGQIPVVTGRNSDTSPFSGGDDMEGYNPMVRSTAVLMGLHLQ